MQTINQELIEELLDKINIFAVVGVSKNKEKFGYKVYFDLKQAGYSVYPVNPNVKMISNDKCYPSLNKLPTLPDVVNIVVPPNIALKTIKECKTLKINKVWMQPGSESEQAVNYCKENGIKVLYGVCVMLERRKYKKEK